jgi:hypothetical protein
MDFRVPDKTIIVKCESKTQKNSRILQVFRARQWQHNCRYGTRLMYPCRSLYNEEFWDNHFRLRLDGSWMRESAFKYHFFTADQVQGIVAGLLEF